MNAIGMDVGGTKIAAGVVSPGGELLNEVRYPTENTREELLATITEAIAEVGRGYGVGGVCLAVPGFILARENKQTFRHRGLRPFRQGSFYSHPAGFTVLPSSLLAFQAQTQVKFAASGE